MPQTSLFLSSETTAGAVDVSSSRDEFSVNFSPSLEIPADASPELTVGSAQVWWSVYNISAALGNNTFYYTDDTGDEDKYSVVLTDGLYGTAALSAALDRGVVANGHASGLFTLTGIDATGRCYLNKADSGATGYQWCFLAGSPYAELGFSLDDKFPSGSTTTGTLAQESDSVVSLNTVSSILVHCSLSSGESRVGGSTASAIAAVVPDVSPGSLINYRPYFPRWIGAPHLRGTKISRITMSLTDQTGARGTINTGGEDWGVELLLKW